MKVLIILLTFLIQSVCFVYATPTVQQRLYKRALYNRAFNRGVMTGVPYPIYQYTPIVIEPQVQQPTYVKRKHIKKKYRKYYPAESENSFTIIEY